VLNLPARHSINITLAVLICPMNATCLSHLIPSIHHHIFIRCTVQTMINHTFFHSFFHSPVPLSVLTPNIFLSTLFANVFKLPQIFALMAVNNTGFCITSVAEAKQPLNIWSNVLSGIMFRANAEHQLQDSLSALH